MHRPAASLALALAGLAASAPAAADPHCAPAMSIHQLELEAHRGEPPALRRPLPAAAARARTLSRVVYGYYPYWVAGLDGIQWDRLTHLAWFALELDGTGAIVDAHGWPDAATVAAAHAAGVRVDLTFTLFSGDGIRALLGDPARRGAAITAMVDQLEAGGADGISIDFEGFPDGSRDPFTAFIGELRSALEARGHVGAGISIAVPAVNGGGADGIPEIDTRGLLAHADYLFIMGYGYFWSGSAHAGPVGLLRLTPAWREVSRSSSQRSIAAYAVEAGAAGRRQLVFGVPYYGREWITADDQPRSAAVESVGALPYSRAVDGRAVRAPRWDADISQAWYTWMDSTGWHQVWFDDADSLAARYQMIVEQDLGGVGVWALNYDRPRAELWQLLALSFSGEPPPVPGDRRAPLVIDRLPFSDARSTATGPGNYFDRYGCSDADEYGREWVYRVDLAAAGHLTARVDSDPGADIDIHLLSALDEAACLARGDRSLGAELAAGTYYLVADTFARDGVTAEGGFRLAVDVGPPGSGADAGAEPGDDRAGCGCAGGGADAGGALAPVLIAAVGASLRRRRS